MRLSKIYFENYKAFPRGETVELRPLTVFIGRNSSGKSALVRLPILLSSAMGEFADAPVPLPTWDQDGVDMGESFIDLVHNRLSNGAIGLGGEFADRDGHRVVIRAKIQHIRELRLQVISELDLTLPDAPGLRLRWNVDSAGEEPREYECMLGEGREARCWTGKASFIGILPDTIEGWQCPSWPGWRKRIREAVAEIGYLGPFRIDPERYYRYPGGTPTHVGVNGEDAATFLAADALRFNRVVLSKVSEWYRKHLGGWELDISEQGNLFSLVLRDPAVSQSQPVNLVDAGVGLSQILAIVVQRIFDNQIRGRAREADEPGSIEITEQPELHLHPAAHISLADLYVDGVTRQRGLFLVETHSENFILRLRRRIVDKTLPAEAVRIYWVDPVPGHGSAIKPIDITPDGDVSDWPAGVFSEDFEELMAIRRLRKQQSRNRSAGSGQ
ncbi:MAG: AAA family ATPase [Proteobacteria bacterium]|nr:AAA family ATPase [Pseudomonadota bacterium]